MEKKSKKKEKTLKKWSQMVKMVKDSKKEHGQYGLKWSKMVKNGKKNGKKHGGPDLSGPDLPA